MITLTYLSTATVDFDQAGLSELLAVSRRNNHAAGLTGMLLFVDGHFIQTLEGEEDRVEAAFTRIESDRRHREVLVAVREETSQRVFPDWSMGFEELSEEQAAELPGFNDFLAARTEQQVTAADLGSAGIFHRIFRDRMRGDGR